MLTAGLLILSLLSVGAVWLALSRLRASERRREQSKRELAFANERHGRELAALREELEGERRRAALRSREEARADEGRREETAAEESPTEPSAEAGASPPDSSADAVLAVLDGPPTDSASGESASRPAGTTTAAADEEVSALAWGLDDFFQRTTHPRELLAEPTFRRGVEMLSGDGHTTRDLLAHALGTHSVLACMALEALARRPAP